MTNEKLHRPPSRDPVSGGELYISELRNDESGVTIRGKFEMPRYSRLDPEQSKFLETFLRCRGMLSSMERELGISYPTVRARLDALLESLELKAVKDDARSPRVDDQKAKVLDLLEKGEISAEEAKIRIKQGAKA